MVVIAVVVVVLLFLSCHSEVKVNVTAPSPLYRSGGSRVQACTIPSKATRSYRIDWPPIRESRVQIIRESGHIMMARRAWLAFGRESRLVGSKAFPFHSATISDWAFGGGL